MINNPNVLPKNPHVKRSSWLFLQIMQIASAERGNFCRRGSIFSVLRAFIITWQATKLENAAEIISGLRS
jgi:hypothetical protein